MEIVKIDDMHVHIRQGEALKSYLEDGAPYVKRIVAMPNATPAIDTVERLLDYKKQIADAKTNVESIPIFKLHDALDPAIVKDFKKAGAAAAKLYPVGATTNSEEGVGDVRKIKDILKALEEEDLVLSIHGELTTSFCLDREADYLQEILFVLENFPKLRVVMEHLSDRRSVDFVEEQAKKRRIAATITAHHMLLDLDDLLGNNLNPHHFCKPIVKTPADKKRLVQAAVSGNPRFFFGSDSAPHPVENKEKKGAAGVYSAPVAVPLLFEIFEKAGALNKLEAFASVFGADFYGLERNREKISLVKKPWVVDRLYSGCVPLWFGKTINWSLE